jgi:hypothetical protein
MEGKGNVSDQDRERGVAREIEQRRKEKGERKRRGGVKKGQEGHLLQLVQQARASHLS